MKNEEGLDLGHKSAFIEELGGEWRGLPHLTVLYGISKINPLVTFILPMIRLLRNFQEVLVFIKLEKVSK